MRNVNGTVLFAMMLAAAGAQASDAASMEKVKSGLLPSGGLYSMYAVDCGDRSSASLASLEGGRRWCTSIGQELDCFRQSAAALAQACDESEKLAAVDTATDAVGSQR